MKDVDRLLDHEAYAHPDLLDADVVMKGGITSGIVYPRAVARLARQYRFRNLGGTSAGAIAAAAAAAAEKGRSVPGGGFAALAMVPDELAEGKPGNSRLLRLFQPDRRTRRLFRLATAILKRGKWGALSALWHFWMFPLFALVLIVTAVTVAALGESDVALAVAVSIAALVLAVAGPLAQVIRDALRRIPDNDFGLCRLFAPPSEPDREPLTVWLYHQLQKLSGKATDSPLMFGDLWGIPETAIGDERERHAERLGGDVAARAVNLEVITTDLTHGRPLRLPVPFRPGTGTPVEAGGLLFVPEELRRFFPEKVVDHMEAFDRRHPIDAEREAHLKELDGQRKFCRFPVGPDLPVVVAARMSLSFPILISAVPLWELDFGSGEPRPPLKRVIFSDGGITSNFPVHFFDAIVPRRPTFGINLTSFPPGQSPHDSDESRNVDPPPLVAARVPEHYREIHGLLGFGTAIKDAMQNWRDNAQARTPGFKERIVHVKLARREGGMNLGMDQTKLSALSRRGEQAGVVLGERFAQPKGNGYSNWNRYRFARYRTGMALIERLLRAADRGIGAPPDAVTIPYKELIEAGDGGQGLSYEFKSRKRLRLARDTTRLYGELVQLWDGDLDHVELKYEDGRDTLADANVPRPEPELRIVPPA